jgi:hypothetical protein
MPLTTAKSGKRRSAIFYSFLYLFQAEAVQRPGIIAQMPFFTSVCESVSPAGRSSESRAGNGPTTRIDEYSQHGY